MVQQTENDVMRNRLPYHEKYRWKDMDEIVGQDEIVEYLKKLESLPVERTPHMIFKGPPGTGKSTIAYAYQPGMLQTVLNVASTPGVQLARELENMLKLRRSIFEYCTDKRTGKNYIGHKIILTEADRLTEDAQKILQQPLEECIGTLKIIITANDIILLYLNEFTLLKA